MSAELKSLSIYSLSEALSKITNKDKSNKPGSTSPAKAPLKGAITTIAERTEGKESKGDDKPIRRTVSFTNSVAVFGGNDYDDDEEDSQPNTTPMKIKRTRSSERFNVKERRRSSVLSNK